MARITLLLIFLSIMAGCSHIPQDIMNPLKNLADILKDIGDDVKKTPDILKKEGAELLSKLGLDNYFYKFLGDPNKRYIQYNDKNEGIYTKTGKKVVVPDKDERLYHEMVLKASRKHGVPPARIYAVIKAESSFNAKAVSPAGAQGLMQLMPETAKALGVRNAFDPAQNIDGGTRYLGMLYSLYRRWDLAHAAYNAGPGNVKKHGNKVPPYEETQKYVVRVSRYYDYYDKRV